MLKGEAEWKPIPGFPNYLISSSGQIKNMNSYAGKPRLLVQTLRNNKYFYVTLTNQSHRKGFPLDRLMIISFFNVCESKIRRVIHLDGMQCNNQLSNLSW
jgi:hypothetical protein